MDHSDRDYYNTENEEDEYEEEETEEQSEETNSSYENEEVVVMKDTNLNSSKEIVRLNFIHNKNNYLLAINVATSKSF